MTLVLLLASRFMLAPCRIQTRIRNHKPFHWFSSHQMRFDNRVHVGGSYVAVPHRFRIDDDSGAMLALVEASGFVGADGAGESAHGESFLEGLLQLAGAVGVAGDLGIFGQALVVADENVVREFRHASTLTRLWRLEESQQSAALVVQGYHKLSSLAEGSHALQAAISRRHCNNGPDAINGMSRIGHVPAAMTVNCWSGLLVRQSRRSRPPDW